MEKRLIYKYDVSFSLNGASQGIVELGALGVAERAHAVLADLRTNSAYFLYVAPTRGAAADVFSATSQSRFCSSQGGGGFLNQPAGGSVTIRSNSADDIGKTFTIYAALDGSTTIILGKKTLAAANADEDFTDADGGAVTTWGTVLAVEVSAALVGTATLKEKSGGLTITTLAPAATSKGIVEVATASQYAFGLPIYMVSEGASVKEVGFWGDKVNGNDTGEMVALTGLTALYGTQNFKRVTKVLLGDLEAAANDVSAGLYGIVQGCGADMLTHGWSQSPDQNRVSGAQQRLLWALYDDVTLGQGGALDWGYARVYEARE